MEEGAVGICHCRGTCVRIEIVKAVCLSIPREACESEKLKPPYLDLQGTDTRLSSHWKGVNKVWWHANHQHDHHIHSPALSPIKIPSQCGL